MVSVSLMFLDLTVPLTILVFNYFKASSHFESVTESQKHQGWKMHTKSSSPTIQSNYHQ